MSIKQVTSAIAVKLVRFTMTHPNFQFALINHNELLFTHNESFWCLYENFY